MKLKVTAADKWFSKCVRERVAYVCEGFDCGLDGSNNTGYMDCSHFVSRVYNATRYHPMVAVCHCKSCHSKLGGGRGGSGNQAEFSYQHKMIHSEFEQEVIRLLSKRTFNNHKFFLQDIGDFFREIYKEMLEKRKDGFHGRLDFPRYDGCAEMNAIEQEIREQVKSEFIELGKVVL